MSTTDRELEELDDWPGHRRLPPAGSVWTCIFGGGAVVLGVAGLMVPAPDRELWLFCFVFAGVLAVVGGMSLVHDIAAAGSRTLHAPGAALRYFLLQIRGMRYGAARAAVAGHAAAVTRHIPFKDVWCGREGPLKGLVVTGFEILGVKAIVEDAALVRVSIRARSLGPAAALALWFGPLAYVVLAFMTKRTFDLHKLVVKRQGRWYLVHGMPDDAVDSALAEAIRARAEAA